MTNLALEGEARREELLALNTRLNALIKAEVGRDDGSHLPGPVFQWQVW